MYALDSVQGQTAFELGATAAKAEKAQEAYRELVEELEALTDERQREILVLQDGGQGWKELFDGGGGVLKWKAEGY